MQPRDYEKISLRAERMFFELQDRIMSDVVRRIKKAGTITSTADYQIYKLVKGGKSTEYIESEIKRLTGITDAELWKIYDEVINKDYVRNKSIYEQINANYIPPEDNELLKTYVAAIESQTKAELFNISRSLGFSVPYGKNKNVFMPLAQYYQQYVDRACLDVVTGSFDYNTVLRRVTREMTGSGLRTVNYVSAAGRSTSRRATVAARSAIMTGVNQLSAQINEQTAKDLGTNDFEVTWHTGHRPDHWWGGMVFSYEDLQRVCHLGEVTGLCGANCYHSYHAFIKGISVRTYTDSQLADLRTREQIEYTWQGQKYNAHTATQKQRSMETRMRAQRERVKYLKQGGADEQYITEWRAKYTKLLHEYKAFSKKMNLQPDMARVYVDMLGRIA